MLKAGTGLVVLSSGEQMYEDLLGPVRSDVPLLRQMWLDAESELDEEPGKQWAVAAVWHQGSWVAAAWAAAVEREHEGQTILHCCNNYEVPAFRGKGLYRQAILHRQTAVVRRRNLPGRTFIFDQPRPLHEALGWHVVDSGVSQVDGVPTHVWFEMWWTPPGGTRRPAVKKGVSEPRSRPGA